MQIGKKEKLEFNMDEKNKIEDIIVPTLFIQSMDDPLFGNQYVDVSEYNNNIIMLGMESGSHVSFIGGSLIPNSN
jgi:predicted alpha/beta-fold hydrolase